jgi:hypothetical protein
MSTALLLLLALQISSAFAAGVPAPDDSEVTVLPPSLLVSRRFMFINFLNVFLCFSSIISHQIQYKGSGRGGSNLQEATGSSTESTCNVNSEDLVVTARAAVIRILKGMCCNTSTWRTF